MRPVASRLELPEEEGCGAPFEVSVEFKLRDNDWKSLDQFSSSAVCLTVDPSIGYRNRRAAGGGACE